MLAHCWLHIGVEKTGTTSIQSFLAANRTALRAEGRLYPIVPGAVGHLGLVAFALDDDPAWTARGRPAILLRPHSSPIFATSSFARW